MSAHLITCMTNQCLGLSKFWSIILRLFFNNCLTCSETSFGRISWSKWMLLVNLKEWKKAKISNQYNEVPHLIRDTIWEETKEQGNITDYRAKRLAPSRQLITRLQGTDKTV